MYNVYFFLNVIGIIPKFIQVAKYKKFNLDKLIKFPYNNNKLC